jgi:hypothetical protein
MDPQTNTLAPIRFDAQAIARHEAGHAVLAVAFGSTIMAISIDPEGNRGKVKLDPPMAEMEGRLACDFAGPLSQVLRYESSVREYQPLISQSIILEENDFRRNLAVYNALNWGKDMLLTYHMVVGMRGQFKPLETALKAYLQRNTVQGALLAVEEALLKCFEPDPAMIQELITSALQDDDYYPSVSRAFRGIGLSGPVREECE